MISTFVFEAFDRWDDGSCQDADELFYGEDSARYIKSHDMAQSG